jgi:lipopolysaccharide biosynthesis glycosyltransferase
MEGHPVKVFIGWDASELKAHLVAVHSLHGHATARHDVRRVSLDELTAKGLYRRPTRSGPNGQLFDVLSDAPMSTGHAIARFFVPYLCDYKGWALFTDGDVLFRDDIAKLEACADPSKAVMVVQHPPMPEAATKKDGHAQTSYPRKNWSSVMLFNNEHPANQLLWTTVLNQWPGRDLHAFRWLNDDQIGALPSRWNWLVNVSAPEPDPAIVHYTTGTPDLPDHSADPYADEWRLAAKYAGYRETVKA